MRTQDRERGGGRRMPSPWLWSQVGVQAEVRGTHQVQLWLWRNPDPFPPDLCVQRRWNLTKLCPLHYLPARRALPCWMSCTMTQRTLSGLVGLCVPFFWSRLLGFNSQGKQLFIDCVHYNPPSSPDVIVNSGLWGSHSRLGCHPWEANATCSEDRVLPGQDKDAFQRLKKRAPRPAPGHQGQHQGNVILTPTSSLHAVHE